MTYTHRYHSSLNTTKAPKTVHSCFIFMSHTIYRFSFCAFAARHCQDALSTAAFSRAMFIQCSQLAGQLAVLLRCLTKACKEQLEKKLKTSSPISHSDDLEIAPLMSGMLIVGRLAWLLKIRGRFIEEALVQSSRVKFDRGGAFASSISADLSSEEQLRSAFEIADTDGDGVVTNAEAVEAIQALSTSIVIDINAPPQHLSPSISPSLSFDEFVLVCNNIVNEDESRPLERFRSCVDEVLRAAHDSWSSALADGTYVFLSICFFQCSCLLVFAFSLDAL